MNNVRWRIFPIIFFLFLSGCADEASDTSFNLQPNILAITADPQIVRPGELSTITVTANILNHDEPSYQYSCTDGTINGTGAEVVWIAPEDVGDYDITVKVSDGYGGESTAEVRITVIDEDSPNPISIIIKISGMT